jgi:hypothetical protein
MESSPQILAPRLLRDSSQTVLTQENGTFSGTARTRPFGRLWNDTPDNAIGYAMHSSRSHDAVIRVYDAAGNVIEAHEHKGRFKDW